MSASSREGGRRYSTFEVVPSTSYREERYLSVPSVAIVSAPSGSIEIASRSSTSLQAVSRDGSRRGSTLDIASSASYREGRYLSVPSEPLEQSRSNSARRERSRDASRRGSTLEVASKTRTRSLSPNPKAVSRVASRYSYSPLDPKVKRAIRVIRISPDLEREKLSCDIEHTSTSSTYSALSYTWGSAQGAQEPILINGQSFTVRQNLYAFLCHARKYYAGKPLWIDALCINQDDIGEKNRQVKMMSKIYSETKEVLVWLGPRVEYVGHAIRRMQDYETMSDTEMAVSSSKDSDFWKGFKAINKAPYWDRVWVIQEFIQPRNGKIIQGDRSISFETFQNTIRRFNNKIYRLGLQYWVFGSRRNDHFSDYISNIHPLWQRRLERVKYSSSTHDADAAWALLSGSRFCQDIRDRVYGIMPLATHGGTLDVDYHLNPFEVLLESIWLEHDSDMDRTEVLMNLANILLLTPASICMYAQKRTSRADRHLKKIPRDRDAMKMHLKAASSQTRQEDWLLAAAGGRKLEWRNFARRSTPQDAERPARVSRQEAVSVEHVCLHLL